MDLLLSFSDILPNQLFVVHLIQLPVVALVANISSHNHLTYSDLETLCHEFGHALHSILSRTEFQHLSGTRGPQDVIEVPSHVFEGFASDPKALKLMAKSAGGCREELSDAVFLAPLERKRCFASIHLQKTLEMCLLDQFLHGPCVSSLSLQDLNHKITEFMEQHEIRRLRTMNFPPLRFSHLVGYGGNYYSYLFANSIASEVWNCSGEGWPSSSMLKENMLKPGGALPAAKYIEGMFKDRKKSDVLIYQIDPIRRKEGCYPNSLAYLQRVGI